jgi:hypothetical protein
VSLADVSTAARAENNFLHSASFQTVVAVPHSTGLQYLFEPGGRMAGDGDNRLGVFAGLSPFFNVLH